MIRNDGVFNTCGVDFTWVDLTDSTRSRKVFDFRVPSADVATLPFVSDWHRHTTDEGLQLIPHYVDSVRGSLRNDETLNGRRGAPIDIHTGPGLTSITISGDIGAVDIAELSPRARGLIRECGALVVNLCGTDFIAVDGLHALLALWCASEDAPRPAPIRVLRICSEHFTVALRRCG